MSKQRFGLTIGHERPDEESNLKQVGLLDAGDPKGEVRNAWHAKEVVRSIYAIEDPVKPALGQIRLL